VICDRCWTARNPLRRPFRVVVGVPTESCCFCGLATRSGIYVRQDPMTVPCSGLGTRHRDA